MLLELRRDPTHAGITSLFFSPTGFYLGACTHQTVEIMKLSTGPVTESSHTSGASSPASAISNRLSDALRRCVGKASAECVICLPVSHAPPQIVFGSKPLSMTALLAHGVLLQFCFESTLSSEPVLKKYTRVIGSGMKEVEEAHASEWVLLDEEKIGDQPRPDEQVAW